MGTMFLLANLGRERESILWEKSSARMGAGSEELADGVHPTHDDEAVMDGAPELLSVVEETNPTIASASPRRSWGTPCGWGRCLSRARVRSPVPQQRSRTTASGR